MKVEVQIQEYISCLPEPKRRDLEALHEFILQTSPGCKLWFLDGTDGAGKVVSNPNIGYGETLIKYADGSSREFYRVGLSANTAGISVYVMGLEDKTLLTKTYGQRIGKAKVTGYCIKFKSLSEIDVEVLQEAFRFAFDHPNA